MKDEIVTQNTCSSSSADISSKKAFYWPRIVCDINVPLVAGRLDISLRIKLDRDTLHQKNV